MALDSAMWSLRAGAMATECGPLSGKSERQWYCFGQKLLRMDCDDHAFSRRFKEIYGECAVEPPEDITTPRVDFRVAVIPSDPGILAVSIIPHPPDGADFMRRLVPE